MRLSQLSFGLLASCLMATASAATLKAEYLFNNTLVSSAPGAPALVAVNPTGGNTFLSDTVFGQGRTVYSTTSTASQQSGLTLDSTGLVTANDYSLQVVLNVSGSNSNSSWKRLIQTGVNDYGLYVDGSGKLDIYSAGSHPGGTFSLNAWHDLVTVVSAGTARVYLDGALSLTFTTNVLNITAPSDILRLYLDDMAEYTSARTAAVRLWNGALTSLEVAALDASGLPPQGNIPEPGVLALLASALGLRSWQRRTG